MSSTRRTQLVCSSLSQPLHTASLLLSSPSGFRGSPVYPQPQHTAPRPMDCDDVPVGPSRSSARKRSV